MKWQRLQGSHKQKAKPRQAKCAILKPYMTYEGGLWTYEKTQHKNT